ncbi:MAG: LysE family translocator [Rhodobacteraceae bacterium]|nr:LysE family translocator [Paracoccaceae bacterium]
MTVTLAQLALYAGALLILWVTPGPVFVAIAARSMTGGFASAWPLALGVTIGDVVWPLVAIFGLTAVVGDHAHLLGILRWVAAAVFAMMGAGLVAHAGRPISADGRLTRPGRWAGFSAGVAAILGNPKAILFYMGVLPGFFDLARVTLPDIVVIIALSTTIPLIGNLLAAATVARVRARLTSPAVLRRVNLTAGALLIVVGVVIALI